MNPRLNILLLCSLSLVLLTCKKNKQSPELNLVWVNSHLPEFNFKLSKHQKKLIENTEDLNAVFQLFMIEDGQPAKRSVQVTYKVENDSIYIRPFLKLGANIQFRYQVYTQLDTLGNTFKTPLQIRRDPSSVNVNRIFPLSDHLPSNTLMFHVVFDFPMLEDPYAYRYIQIRGEDGDTLQSVWREKSEWTDQGKHLVLMVHPGRIKRGINYMEDEPLFEVGKTYTLTVGKGLRDHYNQPLNSSYQKTFTIQESDRLSPKLSMESQGQSRSLLNTRKPLLITFNEPMDYGSVKAGLRLVDQNNKAIAGKLKALNDLNWEFIPDSLWEYRKLELILDDCLTDLASNHMTRKFEERHIELLKRTHSSIVLR